MKRKVIIKQFKKVNGTKCPLPASSGPQVPSASEAATVSHLRSSFCIYHHSVCRGIYILPTFSFLKKKILLIHTLYLALKKKKISLAVFSSLNEVKNIAGGWWWWGTWVQI